MLLLEALPQLIRTPPSEITAMNAQADLMCLSVVSRNALRLGIHDMTAMSWQCDLSSIPGIAATRVVMNFAVEIVEQMVSEHVTLGGVTSRDFIYKGTFRF